MAEATLSAKNQIVIPRDARKALGLKPGDKVIITVLGDKVIVLERPRSYERAIRGLSKRRYPEGYLEEERRSWD